MPRWRPNAWTLGLYVSFAGNVTYTNKKFQSLREAAATVPADRILIETDSPYLTPEPLRRPCKHGARQKRNEPALVVHTAAALAALRGLPLDEFVRQTAANARRLFQLDCWSVEFSKRRILAWP